MILAATVIALVVRAAPPAKPAETPSDQLAAAAVLATNNVNAALHIYDSILQRSRTSPEAQEALYRRGIMLRALKRMKDRDHEWAAAKDLLQQALVSWENVIGILGPSDWKDDALLELAGTHTFELNKPEVGLGFYNKLFQEYPRSDRIMEARFQVAVLQFQKGDIASAKTNLEKFLTDYPGSPDRAQATIWLAKCVKAKPNLPGTGPTSKRQSEVWLTQADAAFRNDDYKGAQSLYQQVIATAKTFPEYDKAICRSAKCLARLDQYEQALKTVDELLRLKPNSELAPAALLIAGNIYLELADLPSEAQKFFARIQSDYPQSELTNPARFQTAIAWARLGQFEKAREIFKTVRAARGDDENKPPPYDVDRLIKACDSQEFAQPDAARAGAANERWKSLGDLMFAARKFAEALRAYTRLTTGRALPEDEAYAAFQSGRCNFQLGKSDKALEQFRLFHDKYQKSQWADDALLRAGVILAGPHGKPAESVALFQKIVQQYPTGNVADQALLNVALVSLWQLEKAQAAQLGNQLAQKYPDSLYVPFVRTALLPATQKPKRDPEGRIPPRLPTAAIPSDKTMSLAVPNSNALVTFHIVPAHPDFKGLKWSSVASLDPQQDTLLWIHGDTGCYRHVITVAAPMTGRLWLSVWGLLQPIESCSGVTVRVPLFTVNVPRVEQEEQADIGEEWN